MHFHVCASVHILCHTTLDFFRRSFCFGATISRDTFRFQLIHMWQIILSQQQTCQMEGNTKKWVHLANAFHVIIMAE